MTWDTKKISLLLGLILALIVIVIVVLRVRFPESDRGVVKQMLSKISECPSVIKSTWKLDLTTKSLNQLGQAEAPWPMCDADAPNGNVTIEISEGSDKVVYKRRVYVSLTDHFEYTDTSGQIRGGSRPSKTTILTTYIPPKTDSTKSYVLRVISLKDSSIIAEGKI